MACSSLAVTVCGLVLLAAAAPFARADVACPASQYRDPADDTCKKCVSVNSPFHATLTGNNGKKCYFHESGASVNTCARTNVPVKVRSADPSKIARCINPNYKEHTIIFPLSISQLPGFVYQDYKKATLRLQGLKTRKTTSGNTAYTLKTSGVTKGLAITFEDKYGILKKRAGTAIDLVGVLRNANIGGLDLCFISKPVVCPV